MAAGLRRGKCIIPHRVHLIASSPGTRSVSPPQRPQNRCVVCQPTNCFARPAIPKKKLRKSLNSMPAGGPASGSTSTAQQACPSRSPISHLNLMSRSSSSGLSASGTRTGPSSNTSSLSPWKANHSACSRSANGLRVVEQQGKILGRVQCPPFCSVQDLLAAARPRREDYSLPCLAHRREESPLSHLHRDLVVSLLITEEPGHTTASRVDHLDVGGEPEQPLCRARTYQRLLVAVSVQEDRGAFSQRKLPVEIQHRLLEEAGGCRQLFDALVIGEKFPVIVAQGQDAARFEADQRDATFHEGHQEIQVSPGILPCLVDKPLRQHWPPTTDDLGQVYSRSRGCE